MTNLLYIILSLLEILLLVYILKKKFFPLAVVVILFGMISGIHVGIADANIGDTVYGISITPAIRFFSIALIVLNVVFPVSIGAKS